MKRGGGGFGSKPALMMVEKVPLVSFPGSSSSNEGEDGEDESEIGGCVTKTKRQQLKENINVFGVYFLILSTIRVIKNNKNNKTTNTKNNKNNKLNIISSSLLSTSVFSFYS